MYVGPHEDKARKELKCFTTFIDDYSKFGYVYLMIHKAEALEMFKEFKESVETQLRRPIRGLSTDRGGVYEFNDLYKNISLRHLNTMPYILEMGYPREEIGHSWKCEVHVCLCGFTFSF